VVTDAARDGPALRPELPKWYKRDVYQFVQFEGMGTAAAA
jgi:hypothetical protein